ncbi:MAG: YggS family pyridoxal phosphate-dependent enzyme [Bacteroidales bacterium]|jgi:pyridoxal phosphate enzyme (YggS family)|nr:YggS family pyridoxal phosphate-dependent enzyme [Bacteroidales bacterium]
MIAENLNKITKLLPPDVKLIAVSKTKPSSDILQAYNCGQRLFGENKALEMRDKYEELPKDIVWHFIGHLQTNKVKYIAPFVSLIHSVDSLKLLKEIDSQAKANSRTIDCLLQISISNEETKFGMDIKEVEDMLSSEDYQQLDNIRLCGVMGIGSITEDKQQTEREFAYLRATFEDLKQRLFANNDCFTEISMGMSDDYDIAIKQGATMIRLGSTIFGHRNYNL